jgi:hypothetical protein
MSKRNIDIDSVDITDILPKTYNPNFSASDISKLALSSPPLDSLETSFNEAQKFRQRVKKVLLDRGVEIEEQYIRPTRSKINRLTKLAQGYRSEIDTIMAEKLSELTLEEQKEALTLPEISDKPISPEAEEECMSATSSSHEMSPLPTVEEYRTNRDIPSDGSDDLEPIPAGKSGNRGCFSCARAINNLKGDQK